MNKIKIVAWYVSNSESQLVNAAVLPTSKVIWRIVFETNIMLIIDKK